MKVPLRIERQSTDMDLYENEEKAILYKCININRNSH